MDWFGVAREELFPEEAEEEKRLNGRFKKFKSVEEISNEDVDFRPEPALDDEDDVFYLDDIDDLADAFGDRVDDELAELAFMKDILQQEEKEEIDKKSIFANLTPFSKEKVKCQIHSRKHGKRGRKKSFRIHIHTKKFDPEIGLMRIIDTLIIPEVNRGRMLKQKMKLLSL